MKVKTTIITFSIIFSFFVGNQFAHEKPIVREVQAQAQDPACVGDALTEYLRAVSINAGDLNHVQLLSPAFNMTNPIGASIANAMTAADPGWISLVNGIAGNAYNCCRYAAAPEGFITQHVQAFRDATGLTIRPILITETGVYDYGVSELEAQLDIIQTGYAPGHGGLYLGALLFNAFNTNGEWERFSFPSVDYIKDNVCHGSCNKLGVNSATNYPESDDFYNKAADLKGSAETFFTLSIANPDISTIDGVKLALQRGLTPVIRIGTAHSAGPDAVSYGKFLQWVDGQVSGTVYAIAGPNEPQSECWAAPACGCDLSPVLWEDNIDHPLEQGFHIGKYSCTQTANPEFHPIRPYPANACDPLIPRSDPEAPTLTLDKVGGLGQYDRADYQRYNTFACGSNLEFSHLEGFDPYGFIDKYAENDTAGIVEDSFGNQFLHTYCETPTLEEQQTTGYYSQTCYRTVGYNIYTDFSNTNIGILGNTQNKDFTEEQKVNNYLSWYFTGTPQIGDNVLLDPDEEEDIDRLINFAGPVRKLLPYDAMILVREVLKFAISGDEIDSPTYDIHDYALNKQHTVRISTVNESISEFFPHIPNSTLEDIAGEAFFTSYGGFGVGARGPEASEEDPEPLTTAPYSLNITCAVGAHQVCPATGPFRIGDGVGTPGGPGGSGTGRCFANCDSDADCNPIFSCDPTKGYCWRDGICWGSGGGNPDPFQCEGVCVSPIACQYPGVGECDDVGTVCCDSPS